MSSLKLESWEEGEAGALEVPPQWRLSEAFVPRGRYIDPDFLALELERLFPRTWLNACRVDEVERVGQYVDFEIGGESIVVVRTEEGLRAYFNACRHRGTRLVQGQGRIGEFRCPFHAWRWNLDGSLKYPGGRRQLRSPAGRRALPARVPGGHLGRMGVHQHGRPGRAPGGLPGAPSRAVGRLQARGHADRLVQVGHPPGQLEDLARRLHRELARARHPPPAAAPRQAPHPADHRRVRAVRRDLQRAVPLPLAPRRHLPLRARRRHHQAAGDLRCRPESHLHQRRLQPARAARPLPQDRPGGGRGAAGTPRAPTGRRGTPSTNSCARSMPGRPASTAPTSPATS